MKTVDEMMNDAFGPGVVRTPRSQAYKAGVRAALQSRIEGRRVYCRYEDGSAESDAFYAGTDEGHRRWREAQEEELQ